MARKKNYKIIECTKHCSPHCVEVELSEHNLKGCQCPKGSDRRFCLGEPEDEECKCDCHKPVETEQGIVIKNTHDYCCSEPEAEGWEERFDKEFGTSEYSDKIYPVKATPIKDFIRKELARARVEERARVLKLAERIKLDVDVIVCDCGEPYRDSDLSISVGELLATLKSK